MVRYLREIAMKPSSWLVAGAAGLGIYLLLRASGVSLRKQVRREMPQSGPRIVILGAGFAGLAAARALRQRLGNQGRILMIDRHNYHLFTPLLFQVAACGVDPYDAAYPVHHYTGRHGIDFRKGTVTAIDLDKQRVQLDDGEVDYDYLIIALGSTTNFFGIQSAVEHALPLKLLEDGVAIRNHVIGMLESATITADPSERRSLLTFVVVGGGATGVEAAGALADLLQRIVPHDYPNLDPSLPRVLVLEATGKLLGHMGERLSSIALYRLRAMGVEVWLNARAKDVGLQQVTTEDGRTVSTRTIIWATGVRIPEVVASLDVQHGKGGSLAVDEYLQVMGHPGIFAVGDNAHVVDPQTKRSVPLLAAAAVQEGAVVAENVARAIEGRPPVTFRYRPLGNAISLGRFAGAIEIGGFVVNGFIGWLGWRLVHLARITGFRNKLATALDWSVGYLYQEDTAELELKPASTAIASDGMANSE